MPEEIERAVVDRIVDGRAVLLVGEDEAEHVVAAADLPDGAGEGAWLLLDAASLGVVGVDDEGEQAKRADLSARMDRLRRRRSGGRFGR